MTIFVSSSLQKTPYFYSLQWAYLLGTTAATAAITAIATTTTAAFVVILFVFLELILAGCRTEISSYTFNF
jgi:hypothetical protein